MKIGFYSPYLDSLSGGERYVFTLASYWSKNHHVYLFWDNPQIISSAANRFGMNLDRVRTVPNFFRQVFPLSRYAKTRDYDLLFFLTDGSIPLSFARHNILHFQVPFQNITIPDFKFKRFNAVVCNSEFTKKSLNSKITQNAVVIYPPVVGLDSRSRKKDRLILTVGRFASDRLKKHEELIAAFKRLYKSRVLSGWRLVIIGGLQSQDSSYFTDLKKSVTGFPIDLVPNADYQFISETYKKSSVYWHAKGYKQTSPECMEHFGISTVEAMSAGCIPVVYGGGGQTEIINHGTDGFLWQTMADLENFTSQIIGERIDTTAIRYRAVTTSFRFSEKVFTREFDRLLSLIKHD